MSAANEAIRRAKEPGHWTPGPWRVDEDGSVGGHLWTVADVADIPGNETEVQSNARLIAAAPEMAELLAAIANAEPSYGMASDRAMRLLSRIRGEAEVSA